MVAAATVLLQLLIRHLLNATVAALIIAPSNISVLNDVFAYAWFIAPLVADNHSPHILDPPEPQRL
jgi:hypothetical protein